MKFCVSFVNYPITTLFLLYDYYWLTSNTADQENCIIDLLLKLNAQSVKDLLFVFKRAINSDFFLKVTSNMSETIKNKSSYSEQALLKIDKFYYIMEFFFKGSIFYKCEKSLN